jgi:hypothetical protein
MTARQQAKNRGQPDWSSASWTRALRLNAFALAPGPGGRESTPRLRRLQPRLFSPPHRLPR